MGHDVTAIGNHKINTTSVVTAALDFAERTKAKVRYGYIDDWVSDDCAQMGSFEFVETGVFKKGDAGEYLFCDEMHIEHIYYPGRHSKEDRLFKIYGEGKTEAWFWIGKESFLSDNSFSSRWWSMWRHFRFETKNGEVNSFRKDVWIDVTNLGGTEVFYADDQGPSVDLENMLAEHTWQEIKEHAFKKFSGEILSVSDWHLRPELYKEPKDYKVFYDDFGDLK